MRAFVAALLLLALSAPGCLRDAPCRAHDELPVGTWAEERVLRCVDGEFREVVLFAPEPWPSTPVPLLVFLHGGGGNADQFAEQTGAEDLGDRLGVLVVFPEGTPARRAENVRTWNAVHCCGEALRRGADDVAFVGDLIRDLKAAYPVDAARVGVAGHSNGAMMAYRLAAERSEDVSVAAPVAGAIGGEADPGDPVRRIVDADEPVSVLIIHSVNDPRVPFEGGQGDNLDGPRVDLSVGEAVAHWRRIDGIEGPPRYENRTNGVLVELHEGGHRDTVVRLLATDGGHGWPGSEPGLFNDAPREPDATLEIFEFLVAQARA